MFYSRRAAVSSHSLRPSTWRLHLSSWALGLRSYHLLTVGFCPPQSAGLLGSFLRAREAVEDGVEGRPGAVLIYLLETVSSPVVKIILVQNQIRTFR